MLAIIHTIKIRGTLKTVSLPNCIKISLFIDIGFVLEIVKAKPLTMLNIPKVTTKGGIFVLETRKPLINPRKVDDIIATVTDINIPQGSIKTATTMDVKATIDPWERSIPPVINTNNCPNARNPIIEYCFTIAHMFNLVRKLGKIRELNIIININTTRGLLLLKKALKRLNILLSFI